MTWRPSLRPSTRGTATSTSRTRLSVSQGPICCSCLTATFPIDLLWDKPTVAGHLRRLASFSRLILTDLLGVQDS